MLTHWGLDTVAAISQTAFWIHFVNWKLLLSDSNYTKINNNPEVNKITVWRRDKPLFKAVMALYTVTYIRHSAYVS